jgi:ubiquinone/menaquinone biosynthesis C-methylase UbiE
VRRPPDRNKALELYRHHAAKYDRAGVVLRRFRRHAVALLALKPGDTVLDVGCGTGLSFDLLRQAVGPTGKVIGVELSPDMAAEARKRVERNAWENVFIANAPAEEATIDDEADAAMFFLVHDVMRNRAALDRTLSFVRDGGGVAAFGVKLPPLWAFGLILPVWLIGRRYVTTYEGIRKPWSHLEEWSPDLQMRPTLAGCTYFAWGHRTSNHPKERP